VQQQVGAVTDTELGELTQRDGGDFGGGGQFDVW
jgi:hypothetical protein